MNGKRSKALRRLAYGPKGKQDETSYQMVASPGQDKRKPPRSVVTDEKRFLYQTLKGRRGMEAI